MPAARTRLTLEPLADRLTPAASGYSVFGAAAGGQPLVQVDRPDGSTLARFTALDAGFTGGVRAAVGELDGDPFTSEVAAGYGPGGPPEVRVFSVDQQTGGVRELARFAAFEDSFRGGVTLAVGDVLHTGAVDQIVVGADTSGGARVRTFFLSDDEAVQADGPLGNFFAFEPSFRNGVRVAAGSLEEGGPDLLFVAAGRGGGPRVTGLQPDGTAVVNFFALDANDRNGLAVGFTSRPAGGGLFYAVTTADDPSQADAGLNAAAGVGVVPVGPVVAAVTDTSALQAVATGPSTGVAIGASGLVIATNGVVFGDPALVNRLGLNTTSLLRTGADTNAAVAIAAGTAGLPPTALSRQSLNLLVANGGTAASQGVIVGSNGRMSSGRVAVVPTGGAVSDGSDLSDRILNQAITAALSDAGL